MYILTDKENTIINISETLDYQKNGNLLVNNGELAIAKMLINKVYEVKEIPNNVSEARYCYTEEKGFYKNESYREYYSEEERISALEDMINMILLGGNE